MQIQHLKRHEIDLTKWDNTILQSINGLIYAQSWFLNTVNEKWEALVSEDYQYIMPLTVGNKWGITYLYQPMFTQQLGIFSQKFLSNEIINAFLKQAEKKFKYLDIKLNIHNTLSTPNPQISMQQTHLLDLIQPYKQLQKKYSKSNLQNIKKAKKCNLTIIKGISLHSFLELKRATANAKKEPLDIDLLRKLAATAIYKRVGELIGAYDNHNNLCAALFIVHDKKRSYLLSSASNQTGRELRASFLLIDNFIETHAEKKRTLDFEGSAIPGVAKRNTGFGAKTVYYPKIKINRLPSILKILKK